MGHSTSHKAPEIPASDGHYFSRTAIEKYRVVYRESVMPHVRLESATPSEMEQTIIELRRKIEEYEQRLSQVEFMADPDKVRDLVEAAKVYKELLQGGVSSAKIEEKIEEPQIKKDKPLKSIFKKSAICLRCGILLKRKDSSCPNHGKMFVKSLSDLMIMEE